MPLSDTVTTANIGRVYGVSRLSASIEGVESMLARAGEAYLVGSANWGVPGVAADRDYALRGDTISTAAMLATTLGGRYVVMDPERRHVRVVLPGAGVVDLAPLAGGSLATDLASRDFTVNAIAAALPGRLPVLDPFRGLTDLRYGIVRQVSPGAMASDPLRVLRAIRLVAERDFLIEAATLASASAAVPLLGGVRPERIHTELMRALSAPGWFTAANLLLDLRVWPALPSSPPLTPNEECCRLLLARLRAAQAQLEAALALPGWPDTSDRFGEARAVAVLAAVMMATPLPLQAMTDAARSLRFTKKQVDLLEHLARASSALASQAANSQSDTAPGGTPHIDGAGLASDHGYAAVLAAALDDRPAALAALLALRPPLPGVLPSGAEMLHHLGKRPGPWLGELLRSLQRAALRGEIADRHDAWLLAERLGGAVAGDHTTAETDDDAAG